MEKKMNWKLINEAISVGADNKINSRSAIVIEHNGLRMRIAETDIVKHAIGSKKVLMDTAYKLEQIAREMKKKARDIN